VEVVFAPEGEGLARIAVPSVAAIAAIAGAAVLGIATGIAPLLVNEARRTLTARANAERVLAGVQGAHE
jgi:hypothetical protein